MTVVLHTGALVALLRARDEHHRAAKDWYATVDEDLVTSPLALAEMDRIAGPVLWDNLESGAIAVRWWADALDESLAIAREHPFLGLTDASLVALANRLRTTRIATFDRHFSTLTNPSGQPYELLP